MSINKWGEEVLGEYREHATSTTNSHYDSEAVWQLQRIREGDYDRREYGREFEFVRFNRYMSQSFRAGAFTRETARELRDMLNRVLLEED